MVSRTATTSFIEHQYLSRLTAPQWISAIQSKKEQSVPGEHRWAASSSDESAMWEWGAARNVPVLVKCDPTDAPRSYAPPPNVVKTRQMNTVDGGKEPLLPPFPDLALSQVMPPISHTTQDLLCHQRCFAVKPDGLGMI